MSNPETIEIRCMWGSIDSKGYWHHSPNLKMSKDEQYRQNELAGYNMKTGGLYSFLRPDIHVILTLA